MKVKLEFSSMLVYKQWSPFTTQRNNHFAVVYHDLVSESGRISGNITTFVNIYTLVWLVAFTVGR